MFQTKAIRHLLIAMTLVIVGLPPAVVVAGSGATAVQAAVVSRIDVRGNRRVDAETIRSYVTVKPGRNFTSLTSMIFCFLRASDSRFCCSYLNLP